MSKSLDAALDERGLAEYKPLLLRNGMMTLADLRGVTDTDLASIGIDKLFHRKRLLQIAAEEEARAQAASQPASGASGSGDHIRVEVLGARGGEKNLSERDHYVKVCLCDKIDHDIYPIENTVQKTGKARGPQPLWPADDKAVMKIKTSFRSHCLALELKEHRMFGENKLIGVLIFPMARFHTFTAGYVEETWHLLRAEADDSSEVTGSIMLRLSVPGGCPKNVGPAYHVTSVMMTTRKLRVNVFDAVLVNNAAEEPSSPKQSDLPSMYVTVHIDSDPAEDETHGKRKSAVVPHSTNPMFDSSFEFFAEAGKCKLMTVKLKRQTGSVFKSHEVVGVVRIPIQYFLAQRNPGDVDSVFNAVDDGGVTRARLHIRLRILPRDAPEDVPVGRFKRTDSLPSEHDPVDVDEHPAFSPKRGRDSGGRKFDDEEALQPKFVSDSDEDETDRAAAMAARRNQRAASQTFGRNDTDDLI